MFALILFLKTDKSITIIAADQSRAASITLIVNYFDNQLMSLGQNSQIQAS